MVDECYWVDRYAQLRNRERPLSKQWVRKQARDLFLDLVGRVRPAKAEPSLRCIYLHHVYDDQVEQFRGLLKGLRSLGRFVGLDDVQAVVNGDKNPETRWFHISFDDGFDNVYRNAFPVLQELGVPATVFVCTRLVDASDDVIRSRWWERSAGGAMTRTLRWSWVREMQAHGIEIGSHTRYHRRLSDISNNEPELRAEVIGSREDIEEKLSAPCRALSWPYGRAKDVDDHAMDVVRAAGYSLCFSAIRGMVHPGRTSRWAVPRHHVEPEWPWAHVRFFALGGMERA